MSNFYINIIFYIYSDISILFKTMFMQSDFDLLVAYKYISGGLDISLLHSTVDPYKI